MFSVHLWTVTFNEVTSNHFKRLLFDFVTGRLLSVRRKSGRLIIHWLWQLNVMSSQAPKVECTYGAAGVSRPGRVTVQGPEKSDQERVCVVALWVYSAVYVCVLHSLLREARPTRWVTPRGRPRPRTSGCESCETSTRVWQTPSESGFLFIGYRWQSWCFLTQ